MHHYALTLRSSNVKTGPIPVSTTSRNSCPGACPLRGNGCYADGGPLGMYWRKVSDGRAGSTLGDFTCAIVQANRGKRGFTYTHHDMSVQANIDAVRAPK